MQFSPARTGTQTRFGGESLFWSRIDGRRRREFLIQRLWEIRGQQLGPGFGGRERRGSPVASVRIDKDYNQGP